MRYGFTGTQQGMTVAQLDRVKVLLGDATELRHGDCVGADAQAHHIVRNLPQNITIIIHPPRVKFKRANCKGDVILPPQDYLDRNHDIVDECERLIATPRETTEQLRSGTWATIRYAQKIGKSLIIVFPNGGTMELNVEDK